MKKGSCQETVLESLTCGPMPGGRDSEALVVPGSILESAMLAWLGSDVMGPSTADMSTHTLTGYSWGAILAQVVFLDTRLPAPVSACYFHWKVPMDGVIEQSCGCPSTRVVCSIRGAAAGGGAA